VDGDLRAFTPRALPPHERLSGDRAARRLVVDTTGIRLDGSSFQIEVEFTFDVV
jgi:hypothetical protein